MAGQGRETLDATIHRRSAALVLFRVCYFLSNVSHPINPEGPITMEGTSRILHAISVPIVSVSSHQLDGHYNLAIKRAYAV